MNALNSVLIEGNMTRDPEIKYTNSGTAVTTFSIASNRYYKKGEDFENEVSYFDIEAWAKLAESCNAYGKKGRGVRVVGRLKQERWEKDGKTMSKVKVIAEHVEFKPERNKETAEGQKDEQTESSGDDIPF